MGEGRIPRMSEEAAKAAAVEAGIPEYMGGLNIFRVLLHHPDLARRINDLLAQMLFKSRVGDRIRELVIMRVGWVTGSDYEWAQHWNIGQSFGVSPDDLLGVRHWEAHGGFAEGERAALAATDELLATGTLSDATHAALVEALGSDEAVIEVVSIVGAWRMISFLARSLAVPLDADLVSWAPDGHAPLH